MDLFSTYNLMFRMRMARLWGLAERMEGLEELDNQVDEGRDVGNPCGRKNGS